MIKKIFSVLKILKTWKIKPEGFIFWRHWILKFIIGSLKPCQQLKKKESMFLIFFHTLRKYFIVFMKISNCFYTCMTLNPVVHIRRICSVAGHILSYIPIKWQKKMRKNGMSLLRLSWSYLPVNKHRLIPLSPCRNSTLRKYFEPRSERRGQWFGS